MPPNLKPISEDSEFKTELSKAERKLVVVDFFATWCAPCQRIAPSFSQLAEKYPKVVFLKVDVDVCPGTAASEGIRAMPTFVLYKNGKKLETIQGANLEGVENKMKAHLGGEGETDDNVDGHMDLMEYVTKSECECLNESDDHTFVGCLDSGPGYLLSDCDEQLILSLTFNQAVKIYSLKVKAPETCGPKIIKLFINLPRTLDFDQGESMEPVQTLELAPQDLDGNPMQLRYVKFQNVLNLQIFIKSNQTGEEVTRIDHLAIYGSPISTTNMGDFKRVAGKKGESH